MISVVIPVYNEADEIDGCLEAFARQTHRGPFELVIVDNGSTDGSRACIEAFRERHPDLTVRLIAEHERGIAVASQTGFEAAQYEIIARTDADTIVDVRWLEAIVRRFQDPRVAALCGHVGFRDPTLLQRALFLEQIIEFHQRVHVALRRPHFWGFNFAVRRGIFRRAGGFNTRLRLGEDLDLGLRLQESRRPGERIVYAPEARVYSSSRRYGLHREWLRYTLEGYRAYFARVWFGRLPDWMYREDPTTPDR
jgi:glycosyltransferase involved in cell wall biosynthesis